MCPLDAIPEPWRSFLSELDQIAASTARLDCIGGFVVTMLYGLNRPAGDVDVLEIAPRSTADAFSQVAMLGGLLFKKYRKYVLYATKLGSKRKPRLPGRGLQFFELRSTQSQCAY